MPRFPIPFVLVLVVPLVGCVSASRYEDLEARHLATRHLLEETREKNKAMGDVHQALRIRLKALEGAMAELSGALRDARVESAGADHLRLERERMQERLAELDRINRSLEESNRTISSQLDDAFSKLATRQGIEYDRGSGRLRIGSEILFPSGEADLSGEGKAILAEVGAAIVAGTPERVRIDGHTDSDPVVRTRDRWPLGNWELSGARALTVLVHLRDRGVPESIMSFAGHGPHAPVADNDSEAGKRQNRRVEIFVRGGNVGVQ